MFARRPSMAAPLLLRNLRPGELPAQQIAEFLQRDGQQNGQDQREQIALDQAVFAAGID